MKTAAGNPQIHSFFIFGKITDSIESSLDVIIIPFGIVKCHLQSSVFTVGEYFNDGVTTTFGKHLLASIFDTVSLGCLLLFTSVISY